MLDFTSALYLGMRHPSWSLSPWPSLTQGVPAALEESPDSRRVARDLAALQGCERGILGTSTLHLFWDLFGMLAGKRVGIYMDDSLYPVARWGVERAVARGVPARSFRHHDPEALRRQLRQDSSGGLRPIVVTDGYCPGCGAAPLAAYRECARAFGGWLILDDTQALGIFGRCPSRQTPYGSGGGGMLVANKMSGPDVLAVSSLAKAFGVPVAVLAGGSSVVEEFERQSETRTHCSPPSAAVIHAAAHALTVNRDSGDMLRQRLAGLVNRFRQRMRQAGLAYTPGIFPVQTLDLAEGTDASRVYRRLMERGIRTVLHRARSGHGLRVSLLITARHSPETIDRAATAIAEELGRRTLNRGVQREAIAP